MKTCIRLKVRNGTKSIIINNLFADSTLGELVNEIHNLINLDINDLELMKGFPPKSIDLTSLATTLSDVDIISGDSLIVQSTPTNAVKKLKLDIYEPATFVKKMTTPKEIINEQSSMSILITKTIPSDNSCLFASIFYCLNSSLNLFDSNSDRQMIAALLISDPDTFTEAYLDNKTPSNYSAWIMNTNNWGGAIELCLLSKLHNIEIVVVNTQYDRLDRFGENEPYSHRILILYDGIHYDALQREYLSDGRIMTRFPIDDKEVLSQAEQLANEARSSKQYTDLGGFIVKCYQCDTIFTGQLAVAKHANDTGHSNFGEIHAA